MAKPIPTTHCKYCGNNLFVDGKKLLKGSTCMKCHANKITNSKRYKRSVVVKAHGNVCADCKQTFPEVCYDFHHLDPGAKDDAVAILIGNNRKLDIILEEASKCVMLCANCHRLRHFK